MSKRDRIEHFFADGDDYEDTLDEALTNAETGRDIDFLVDLGFKWKNYGLSGYLSENQYSRLAALAGLEP